MEFIAKYKGFTLFIYEIVEDDDSISYLGECKKLIYRWRQEGKDGFFRVVDKFKDEVDSYIEREIMINQEHLDTYRKKFEEIKHRAENDLEEDLDWYLLNEEYPELVANILDSLQEFISYQAIPVAKEEVHNQNTQTINGVDSDYATEGLNLQLDEAFEVSVEVVRQDSSEFIRVDDLDLTGERNE